MNEVLEQVKAVPTTDDGHVRQLRTMVANINKKEEAEAICEVMVALFPDIYMDVLKHRYMFTVRSFDKMVDTIEEHQETIRTILGER